MKLYRPNIPWPWNTVLFVALLALIQIPLYVDVSYPIGVFSYEDHPKFFEIALRQVELLRDHQALYGFEHAFQGGIPTVSYLRGNGLVFLPFVFGFGAQLGYFLMVCTAIVMTPVAFLFAIHIHVRDRIVSTTAATMCAFQVGLWPVLGFGNTAFMVAIPLFFTAVGLFTRYTEGRKQDLLLLAPVVALILYTHIGVAANLFLFIAGRTICDVVRSKTPKETIRGTIVNLAPLGCLVILLIAPFLLNYLTHRDLLSIQHEYERPWTFAASFNQLISDHVTWKNPLLASTLLLFIYRMSSSQRRSLVSSALWVGLVIFSIHSIADVVPQASQFAKRADTFESFLSLVNFAIIAQIPNRRWMTVALVSLFSILVFEFEYTRFFDELPMASPKNIDGKLQSMVRDDDHVLIEHCTHRPAGRYNTIRLDSCSYSHRMMMIQRDLGVRLFAQIGDCPHTGNRLRNMYLAAGYLEGLPITDLDSREVDNHLKDWGVSLVCVATTAANMFFGQDVLRYKRVGDSEYYTCYRPTFQVDPEVELIDGGTGEVIEQTPFSLTLRLMPKGDSSSFRLRRNFSQVWKAVDKAGEPVALEECDGMICGNAKGPTEVILSFPNYRLAHICAALTFLVLIGLSFWKSISQYRRPNERDTLLSYDSAE